MQHLVLVLLCLVSACAALPPGREPFVILDEFSDTIPILAILSSPAPPDVHVSGTVSGDDIIGGERDVQISVLEAPRGSVFAVAAFDDSLTYSSPPNSRSILLVQYDGEDNDLDQQDGKLLLNPIGLAGVDLTSSGRADAIFIEVSTDLDTILEFTIYTDATSTSFYSLEVLAASGVHEVEIPFADFVGTADFTNVGAVETRLLADTSVDVIYSELFTSGPSVDPNGGKVYLMNPLSCAPEWPAVIPEFRTSTYSTSFTTTTSTSDDDSDSSSSDDDDDSSGRRGFNPFGSSLSSAEADRLASLTTSISKLSSDELEDLFGDSSRSGHSSTSRSRTNDRDSTSSATRLFSGLALATVLVILL